MSPEIAVLSLSAAVIAFTHTLLGSVALGEVPDKRFALSGMTKDKRFALSGMTKDKRFALFGMTKDKRFALSGMTKDKRFALSGMTAASAAAAEAPRALDEHHCRAVMPGREFSRSDFLDGEKNDR